jgi:hypothetical protein
LFGARQQGLVDRLPGLGAKGADRLMQHRLLRRLRQGQAGKGAKRSRILEVKATDRRSPTVNANGKLYGTTEDSTDYLPILDPAHNSASEIKHPVRDTNTPTSKTAPMEPSPYWGAEPIWDSQTTTHNPMMDEKGRVWFTARVRPPAIAPSCGVLRGPARLFAWNLPRRRCLTGRLPCR